MIFGFGLNLTENEVGRQIVDSAYRIHMTLGPGLLESAYEIVLAYELAERGLRTVRQHEIPIVLIQIVLIQEDPLPFHLGFLKIDEQRHTKAGGPQVIYAFGGRVETTVREMLADVMPFVTNWK